MTVVKRLDKVREDHGEIYTRVVDEVGPGEEEVARTWPLSPSQDLETIPFVAKRGATQLILMI